MNAIALHAPLAGWATALDEVPDEVFAQRMMGDGLAIDPTEAVVRAPCDAEVIAVPETRHAVTLRLGNGGELLIHVGLDTVALGGRGFTAHVAAGQRVKTGDPLIGFDLESVGRDAKSLITPIVVTSEGFAFAPLASNRSVAAGEPIGEVRAAGEQPGEAAPAGVTDEAELVLRAPHGVHARPAARIAAAARAHEAAVELRAGDGRANARSPVAIMALGLEDGDRITVAAEGADAAAAVATIAALIAQGFDANVEEKPPVCSVSAAAGPEGSIAGVCASPGLAVGPVVRLEAPVPEIVEQGTGIAHERERLEAARSALAARLAASGGEAEDIVMAHRSLLEDPELLAAADLEIAAGRSAAFAWRAASRAAAARLAQTGDARLAARIDDLEDIERRLLIALAGADIPAPPPIPEGAILIAETMLPSQLLDLDLGRIGGIATARGGPTSHAAIMAASAGVPMLVAAGDRLLRLAAGAEIVLDALEGWVLPEPGPEALGAARHRLEREQRDRTVRAAAAKEDCRTADGIRIEIFANLASAEEARRAIAEGAEGCGLLRTEFLFHDRGEAPSEAEQAAAYAEVAQALGGRPLIVRTLDAGGDKPLPYLSLPREENPALGLRGVRLGLAWPDLLATQLRAILRASPAGDLRIMVPMIVDAGELRAVRSALESAAAAVGIAPVPLGVMIETPAAALLAGSLAAEADFLSIGTNDLSQYALAADRLNPATADRLDALHPAILRLIASAAEGARRHGKWLGICGGVASDPLACAILIGLGAVELSAAPAAIPALKAAVRRVTMDECRAVAARALEADTAPEVRRIAAERLSPALRGAA